MTNQLFEAAKEWRRRPADECYNSLADLLQAVNERRAASVASEVFLPQAKFAVSESNSLVLQGAHSAAVPSHWAFGQLCRLLDNAPADWLRKVTSELAAQNLNWAAQYAPREKMQMLWANGQNPGIVRCFTSLVYSRLWDEEVAQWLIRVTENEGNGWHHPTSGDPRKNGLYAGDRNMFVFMVNDAYRIDDGSEKGLARGFFCWNSEVGQMSFGFKAFLYQYVCANHIVWGAEELFNLRMFHMGKNMNARAIGEIQRVLGSYAQSSLEFDQAMVNKARQHHLATTREGVLEQLTAKKFGYNSKEAEELVESTEKLGKDPTVVWNLVDAATRLSQNKLWADTRNSQDRRAGKLLEVVF